MLSLCRGNGWGWYAQCYSRVASHRGLYQTSDSNGLGWQTSTGQCGEKQGASGELANLAPLDLAALADCPRWVAWQLQDRKGSRTKVPYDPNRAGLAKADDPTTWGTRAQAEARAAKLPKPHGQGGVGIQLGALTADLAIGGVDLDSCIADGTMEPWARAVVDRFGAYCETSPSGAGAKIFFTYRPADLPALLAAMGTDGGRKWAARGGDHPPAIELYLRGRYFAVTDRPVADTALDLRRVPLADLLWLIQDHGPGAFRDPQATAPRAGQDGSRSAVALRRGKALVANGADFNAMVAGLEADPATAAWVAEKGHADGGRELRRIFEKAGGDGPSWARFLQRDDRGEPIPNLANAMTALRDAPELRGAFAFDLMAATTMIRRAMPGQRGVTTDAPRPATDGDAGALQEWLQRAGLQRLGRETVQQAVDLAATEAAYHPVRDYLAALKWDGTPRLDIWMSYHLGADDGPYTRAVGRLFLISMVARVMRPGCKVDHMPILEGPQGAGKSAACRVLAGGWFSDGLPDVHSSDPVRLAMHLRGKWLIEVAEMSSMSRAESGALKAFLTKDVEVYTPKYGRREVHEPRQCVFIGTTNKAAYLRDETGGRRFWPVKIGTIDVAALRHDRDQLFAEALIAFRRGDPWWPDRDFEAREIAPMQEARREADAWEGAIADWLMGRSRVTILQVARDGLGIEVPRLGTADQRRIATGLELAGWRRSGMSKGVTQWKPAHG